MTFAIDADNCVVKWKHTHPYAPPSFLGANRGTAYLDGRLFRGAGDAHVFAIDASTGASLWDVPIGDQKKGKSVSMAPLAWNGMVFVGNAGGDIFGGKLLWQYRAKTPILAGVTTTAGGLVFTADLNGEVHAFNVRTGKHLWTGDAGQPVAGGVVSYQVDGQQRIAVAAGMKSPIWPVVTTGSRVVVFGLP